MACYYFFNYLKCRVEQHFRFFGTFVRVHDGKVIYHPTWRLKPWFITQTYVIYGRRWNTTLRFCLSRAETCWTLNKTIAGLVLYRVIVSCTPEGNVCLCLNAPANLTNDVCIRFSFRAFLLVWISLSSELEWRGHSSYGRIDVCNDERSPCGLLQPLHYSAAVKVEG